ncbi:MAG: DUF3108 domain-containing protein [Betaproteobacteria bacterium]|nr:DUF3108 domain-containing protein [Betaproteobacteria bacterium]
MLKPNITNKLKKLKWHHLCSKSLWVALIISLLLHALLLSKFTLSLPELNVTHQTLEMRLADVQTAQTLTPAKVKDKILEPKPAAPSKPPSNKENVTPLEPLSAPAVPSTHKVDTSSDTSRTESDITTPQEITSPARFIPTDEDSTQMTNALEDVTEEPKAQPYEYVETLFEVRRGSDKTAAGQTKIIFSMKADMTYKLTSLTEAKGLASLFFGTLKQISEGTVTENGLQPNHYQYQYGNDERKLQHADFFWSTEVLEMSSPKSKKSEQLLPGTQDFLSFMYQFMFTHPLEINNITMTNGKNLRTYTYSFQGEELISTKFATLNTIHLLKQSDTEERTEIWLAIDYRNLPVKLKKTEKDGSVIEQIVTNLSIESSP